MHYESAGSYAAVLVEPKTTPAASRAKSAEPHPAPRRVVWSMREFSSAREYAGVLGVIAAVTALGWFVPISYHAFGHIYLFTVIALSLRVGRWPALVAAVVSAVAWNFVFMPPRLSFSVLDFDDALVLGTYFVAALIGGQLTAHSHAQERLERQREQRATALFHLTRALAAARSLDDAVAAALHQADGLFNARTALLLADERGSLAPHPAGSFHLSGQERAVAEWCCHHGREAGHLTATLPAAEGLHLPMLRAEVRLGVFVLRLPEEVTQLTPTQRDLLEGFTAQIALLVERERLRAAGEREKFFAESDRLHRTLLDSVSHELRTPLAVLRSTAEKIDTTDAAKRASLLGEMRTALHRLDHLVSNLLNQTRLEAGGLHPQPDWCDARDIIGAARRAVGDALAGRPVKIEIPPEMPLFMADAPLMEHVLVNLLLNVALHTPAGSAVRLSTGVDHPRARVFLTVADSGPGLPAELREDLFQKFRRGPAARAGGLGLGLSIVRGFMLAQGGDVIAGPSPQGGASFTVSLPYSAHDQVPLDDR